MKSWIGIFLLGNVLAWADTTTTNPKVYQGGSWSVGRTWNLLNSTDSVNSVQSGAWTMGRTWNLSSGSDSISSVQSGTWSFRLQDGSGNAISSQTSGSQRALDIGINVSGVQVDPRTRTWTLSSGSDSVASVQSGSWTTGRTWTLSSGTDSINSIQGTSPWVTNISQFGGNNVVTGTGNSGSGIPRVTVSNDSSLTNITGTISLPTGASTSANQTSELTKLDTLIANQTNGIQQAKILDASGNGMTQTVITATGSTKRGLDVVELSTATARYFTSFSTQQTAATAANSTIFAMRNAAASTRTVLLENLNCRMGFNASNPLTRTQQTYLFQRFSAATPTGGTALTAALGDSGDAASQVTDIRFLDTGLTTTGVTFVANNLAIMGCDTTQGISCHEILLQHPSAWELGPGEGLAIRLGVAAVAGQSVSCDLAWREQ